MPKADLETLKKELKAHIEDEILLRKEPLGPDEDLFDAGIDSMSLTRIWVFVDEHFGLDIPEQEVVLDQVATLDKLARFVHERLG